MILCRLFSFLFLALFFDAAVAADRKTEVYEKLMALEHRPTIQQVVNAFDGRPPRIEKGLTNEATNREWAEDIKTNLPIAIAKLEALYPGAIWASLGRDSVAIADLLEAFYLGLGQPGRGVRINASSGSFAQDSDDMFIKMLKKLGMRIDANAASRPFVVIDRTSYGSFSQSTKLMQMVYKYHVNKGGQAKTLFRKVAMVSTASGLEIFEKRKFFDEVRLSSKDYDYPTNLAQVSELANFTDQPLAEWHGTFGTLMRYENGMIGGRPGQPSSLTSREKALDMMIKGFQIVKTKIFQDAVRREAKKLGYDFDQNLKMYDKNWKTLELDPNDMDIEDHAAAAIEKFFSDSEASLAPLGLHGLYNHIKNIYQNKIVEALELNEKEHGPQNAKSREKLISAGFDNLQKALGTKNNLSQTKFEYLMNAYFASLSKHEPYDKYFSVNAREINNVFMQAETEHTATEYALIYLRLLEPLVEEEIISSKDYRRLVLYILARIDNHDQFYLSLKDLFKQSPRLKQTLIKHAKVYLTSPRNEGKAREAYLEMIKRNLLPKPTECDLWLNGEGSDEKSNEENLGKAG